MDWVLYDRDLNHERVKMAKRPLGSRDHVDVTIRHIFDFPKVSVVLFSAQYPA